MLFFGLEEREIDISVKKERKPVEIFLARFDLKFEKDVDCTIVFEKNNQIIATGSYSGKVLKCIAVDPDWEGTGLAAKVISILVEKKFTEGEQKLFVFTKPQTALQFISLGFKEITQVENKVSFLEFGFPGIDDYLKDLKRAANDKIAQIKNKVNKLSSIAAIVMNCNPFTLGHQYLIEQAASENDLVYILVVSENKSVFPTRTRKELIKKGTAHLNNVIVLMGGDYIISTATFPSYFTQEQELTEVQAKLDIKIFSVYIAPTLNIKRRYVGEEPYCPVTRKYNEIMKKGLIKNGVEFMKLKRLKMNGKAVSASTVRTLLKKSDFTEVEKLVPYTTFSYLVSENAKHIITNLKKADSRH